MSKYSLNDDSTKFYNKIYRIFIIAFILILIIGLVSNPNNSSNYVLGMIGCAAFILPLFFFVMKHESNLKEKNDDDAEYFGSLLESGEYFNSMEWQFKYQQYTENSKPHHLSSGSLKTDLSLRYIKKAYSINRCERYTQEHHLHGEALQAGHDFQHGRAGRGVCHLLPADDPDHL